MNVIDKELTQTLAEMQHFIKSAVADLGQDRFTATLNEYKEYVSESKPAPEVSYMEVAEYILDKVEANNPDPIPEAEIAIEFFKAMIVIAASQLMGFMDEEFNITIN